MLALRRKDGVSPFKPFFDMSREMESFFNSFYGEPASISAFTPDLDIITNKEEIVVKADLPGFDEKDVEISINEGVLTLKGKREEEKLEETDTCVRSERVFGSFSRQIILPRNVDVDKVKAKFNKGVLEIKLPYSEDAKERKISIESE
jgi:HSP20 family protein